LPTRTRAAPGPGRGNHPAPALHLAAQPCGPSWCCNARRAPPC